MILQNAFKSSQDLFIFIVSNKWLKQICYEIVCQKT